jgi:hypothetical protein
MASLLLHKVKLEHTIQMCNYGYSMRTCVVRELVDGLFLV